MPIRENENTLAEKFADHLMSKIDKICQALKIFKNFKPEVKDVTRFDDFQDLTEDANKRFCPSSTTNELHTIKELEQCAVTINNWMNKNKLKMNTSKTEFIMFGGRPQLNKCFTKVIDIAGDKIESEFCIRYLGAFLD